MYLKMMRLVSLLLCMTGLWARKPNILLFVVDDLGIGDIPCYGNTTIPMPHLARLCHEGTKLTQHTTPAVLCTPSRAALLTGRYAIRSGMTGVEGAPPVIIYSAGTVGLPKNETTFATLLKSAGYKTGYVGKWHLGLNQAKWGDMEHGPLGHGFDYFFGLPFTLVYGFEKDDSFFSLQRAVSTELILPLLLLIPLRFFVDRVTFFYSMILAVAGAWFPLEHFTLHKPAWWQASDFMTKYLNSYLLENNEVVEKPIILKSLGQQLTDRSLDFLDSAARGGEPFLLVHAFTAVHSPIVPGDAFVGRSQHGRYGDLLIEVDHNIGQILNKLRKLGVEENTVVYFTSDHGGDYLQIGKDGGYNGIFRGGKGNGALEGGMRIPGVLKWPGVIKSGAIVSTPTSIMDVLPTLADIAGVDTTWLNLDGVSLLPLLNYNHQSTSRTLYHYCNDQIFAMRTEYQGRTYKLIFKEPQLNRAGGCDQPICPCHGPTIIHYRSPLLIDLAADPEEDDPLDAGSELYRTLLGIMTKELHYFKAEVKRTSLPSQFNSYNIMPRPWLQPFHYV